MRYPERPGSGRSRFGVGPCPPPILTEQTCGLVEQRYRPCGFPPCECDAGKLDLRTCRLRCRTFHETRRAKAAAHASCLQSARLRPVVREIAGATGGSFAHERPGISSASASNIRRPTSVMHRGMRFPGVPLPIRTFAAWPGVGPSLLIAGQRSWGSPAPFAGLLPHRVSGHFWPPGPTCLLVSTARPD